MGWRPMLGVGIFAASLVACSRGPAMGPTERVRGFVPTDTPITSSGVTPEEGGWRVQRAAAGPVPLFEVTQPNGLESAVLTYRARMRAENVTGKAYLEMWVRVPGRGEFFSRGLAQPVSGSSGWASYEIPFLLNEKGARADLVKLNVAFEGAGTVWIKDVELLKASFAS
jgi:hypothetical protein